MPTPRQTPAHMLLPTRLPCTQPSGTPARPGKSVSLVVGLLEYLGLHPVFQTLLDLRRQSVEKSDAILKACKQLQSVMVLGG